MTEPLFAGDATDPRFELVLADRRSDTISRGMLAGDFDIGDMSLATYVWACERGAPLVALPIFLGRRFMQPFIVSREDSSVVPVALRGLCIGVPQYWMTAAVWFRGLLWHEYHLRDRDVRWITNEEERIAVPFPEGVGVKKSSCALPDLLRDGRVDVLFQPRPGQNRREWRPMIENPIPSVLDYLERTGIYPLLHVIVLRKPLIESEPELVPRLITLFSASKCCAYSACERSPVESPIPGLSFVEFSDTIHGDPYPFGVRENRTAIETFLDYAVEQELLLRRVPVEDMFIE